MLNVDLQTLSDRCMQWVSMQPVADSGHDITHIKRVVKSAIEIGSLEHADLYVVIPAAWLHDCVSVSKNSPLRSQASKLSADKAIEFLSSIGFANEKLSAVHHAIMAHSFSADIKTNSIEAKVIQDADRLDSLGAVGIARCFMVGGKLDNSIYDDLAPIPDNRVLNDKAYIIDHFYKKLFKLPPLMQTESGREKAIKRVEFMHAFIGQLRGEIGCE